jgi:hypothetical protein
VALDYGNNSVNAPANGVLELLHVISPQSTNELRALRRNSINPRFYWGFL